MRAWKLLLSLLGALALLATVGYVLLDRTASHWFERDLQQRGQLAIRSARTALVRHWGEPSELVAVLVDITRDERIMAAAACSPTGDLVARTDGMTDSPTCAQVLARLGSTETAVWTSTGPRPAERAIAVRIRRGDGDVGTVVLLHDVAYLERRAATARNFLLGAFVVLALGAILIVLLSARLAWRGWTRELEHALSSASRTTSRSRFEPLVRDVRELVDRLAHERDEPARVGGTWGPERLKATLAEHLQGERIVVLANREPYIHERAGDEIRVLHPASGLVTALEPVMRACSGTWVAHGAGSADRETVDARDTVRVPPGEESYAVRRVWLSEAEETGYYYGFANEGLWPLCHVAHTRPSFRADDWAHYVRVNQRFADAVCDEVDTDDPVVLVQDYHFALAPRMIRERLPRAAILTFWHIPWPNSERFGICPWRDEIISGLLGSSILGFHTQQHCNNFVDSVDSFVESRIDRENTAIIQGAQRTLVRPYPISIEWPVHWLADAPSIAECRASVRHELGLAPEVLLGVGIDRLDYTKGIEERLLAVEELLTTCPEWRGRFVFAQLAAPSRTKLQTYRELNDRVETLAARINARWGTSAYQPIALLRRHHEPATVFRYYRAADLCYVSSLHDGMNLVAKEFVAAHDDEQAVLVLSKFTGAARDLPEALIVNPYDIQQAGRALATALRMPAAEQRERMRSMRSTVAEHNVYRWAGRMLVDAARRRHRDRMVDRLGGSGQVA